MEKKNISYVPPFTARTRVEVEQPTCAATSGEKAKISTTSQQIEVEEYGEVSNDVTFE